MNWKKIDSLSRIQNNGNYSEWKQQISDDCFNQCVYCAIHENPWGGIDHYHIDHFKPKSKFPDLTNVITNLYYACPICNRFKSDDWPCETNDLNVPCYPNPCEHNYADLYELDYNTFNLIGKYISSKYLINRLFLNRAQLIYERREAYLNNRAEILIAEIKRKIESIDDIEIHKSANKLIINTLDHLLKRSKIIPYKLLEIKKKRLN